MKVFRGLPHDQGVGMHALLPAAIETVEKADFSDVYEHNFAVVARWIHALGGPDAEVEDLAQEVFLVVQRKLDGFDGRNLRGWLYAITARTVSDYRRRAWFRNLFARRRDIDLDRIQRSGPGPVELLEAAEARRTVYRLLERMSEKRRTAFVLFEIEGHSGEEIAQLLGVPIATVWTRLHHARREFLARASQLGLEEKP